ncbi:LacI family DNA-binding transcriptional regulator [candidate division WOR-3 bacterium]|nr:LacI family DNA-binding transcriptional regulator [candidate division WOR-3 bacterium]
MITIKDIAKKVGVSPSTVSKALCDRKDVSSTTKKRVKTVVEKLGYSPDSIARALVTKFTKTIGLVTLYIGNPTTIERIKGIQESAFHKHHILISCLNEGNIEEEIEQIETLISRRVDGIILTPVKYNEKLSKIIEKAKIPFVFMSEMLDGVDCDFAGDDDYEGGKLATEHLVTLGHKRIAYFGVSEEIYSDGEIRKGYRKILEQYEIKYDEELVTSGNLDEKALKANLTRILDFKNPPTAIFTWSDIMAIGIFKKLKKRNIKVPDDISLVGYDNMDFASVFHIPLTTISQPNYQIGSTAANLLMERIEIGNQLPPRKVVYKPELIIRESTIEKETKNGKERVN